MNEVRHILALARDAWQEFHWQRYEDRGWPTEAELLSWFRQTFHEAELPETQDGPFPW